MTEKKLKNMKKDELILITWSLGFVWLLIAALVSGVQVISMPMLAYAVLAMMIAAVLLRAVRRIREKRFDTGTLATIETT